MTAGCGAERDGHTDQREHQAGGPADEEQATAAADREQPQWDQRQTEHPP